MTDEEAHQPAATVTGSGDASADHGGLANSGIIIGDVHHHPPAATAAPTLQSLLRTALGSGGQLPRVRDVDPHKVGATPTRHSLDGTARYVARTVDDELRESLRTEPFLLLVGATKAGKSRSAFEAVLATMPDAGFVHPRPERGAVHAMLDLDAQQAIHDGELVLWLDDLHHYLDAGSLDVADLDRAGRREPRAVVVATLPLNRHRDDEPARNVLHRAGKGLIRLSREPRADELRRARQAYPDENFTDAMTGIAERLVAADELVGRLERAADEDPHGAAVARAAIDWVRMGEPAPLTDERLRQLYALEVTHLHPGLDPDDDGYAAGVRWACKPAISRVAILSRTPDDEHTVLDYLADHARGQGWHIPDTAWSYAMRDADPDRLVVVGAAAIRADRPDQAELALTAVAEAGDSRALLLLGTAAESQRRLDAAVDYYRRAVAAGAPAGSRPLALLLVRAGRREEATTWLRRAFHVQADAFIAHELGRLRAAEGDLVEAEYWCSISLALGLPDAAVPLAQLLADSGRAAAASRLLDEAAQGEEPLALRARAVKAELRGDDAEARRLLTDAAQRGDLSAIVRLAQLLLDDDQYAAAEPLLRRQLEEITDWRTCNNLGVTLHRLGRVDEAIEHYLSVVDADPTIALNLGEAYAGKGDPAAAEAWFTRAADAGNVPAMGALGEILFERGDLAGARHRLQAAVEGGDLDSVYPLGVIAEWEGDDAGQLRWYGRAARAGDPRAALHFGRVLARLRRLTPAEYWFRRADPEHHPEAARELRRVLVRKRRLHPETLHRHITAVHQEADEAEVRLRAAAEQGDSTAMVALAKLLARRNDPAGEHLIWWELALGARHPEAILFRGLMLDAAGHTEAALPYFRAAAEAGDAEAAEHTARVLHGLGDADGAARWWRVAAEAGRAESAHNLSVVALSQGDEQTGRRWSRHAAELGLPAAMHMYATLLTGDGQPAAGGRWLLSAAEAGHAAAQRDLGQQAYLDDDEARAVLWLRRAAEQDEPHACFLLGALHEQRAEDAEAFRWYEPAAEQGHPEAGYRLARLIERDGDLPRAEPMYLRAATAGHAGAAYSIGDLQGRRGLHELAETWYRRAAEAGHARAALHVGVYLALRDADPAEVNRWFALWTQHENGTVWYTARTIDPARMTVSIQYTRREPGGDALYSVTTPTTEHLF